MGDAGFLDSGLVLDWPSHVLSLLGSFPGCMTVLFGCFEIMPASTRHWVAREANARRHVAIVENCPA